MILTINISFAFYKVVSRYAVWIKESLVR